MKYAILLLAVMLYAFQAGAFTINPDEYFAYSVPFHGYIRVFLSNELCPIEKRGFSQDWQEKYGAIPKDGQERWMRALYFFTRENMTAPGCWTHVMHGSQAGTLVCIQRQNNKLDTCTSMSRRAFYSTKDLPVAPSHPDF